MLVADPAQSSGTAESIGDNINLDLSKAILEGYDEIKDASVIFLDFIYGKTNSVVAAARVIATARNSQDVESYLYNLSVQIQSLACNYPFLQAQLVSLVLSITRLPLTNLPSDVRSKFFSSFATSLGDLTQSNYGLLFEDGRRTPDLIHDHIYLNSFIARLLANLKQPENPAEVISGSNDALFILSTSLEGGDNSGHGLPNVDIPAAAQYMIHAGEFLYKESVKGTGRDLAANSPLWATRGKLWTGKPGYSCERWDFWKRRFEAAAKISDLDEETKKISKTAAQAMVFSVEEVEKF